MLSFEHNSEWSEVVSGLLNQFGLGDVATVIHSPLRHCSSALNACPWYDERLVKDALDALEVDGLVVDGPPASSKNTGLARFPALPMVSGNFGQSFFVYLDDISRAGEKEIMKRWQHMLGIHPRVERVAGQYAMFRKGGQFAVAVKRYL